MDVLPFLLLAILIVSIFYARKRGRKKLDAEFRATLNTLNIQEYTVLVDKLTTPSTARTTEVYRIVRDSQERYFLYTKIGRLPGSLQPLSKDRALPSAGLQMNKLPPPTLLMSATFALSRDEGPPGYTAHLRQC